MVIGAPFKNVSRLKHGVGDGGSEGVAVAVAVGEGVGGTVAVGVAVGGGVGDIVAVGVDVAVGVGVGAESVNRTTWGS